MRLLDTSSLELVSKRDDNIPPYAILSHTWGEDDEEVSLQDLQRVLAAREEDPNALMTDPVEMRPGFIKIQGAAKLALSEGYGFIWIDTCCIDKTSSAELSEAINSMFRWYEHSAICYVFLSDIEVSGVPSSSPIEEIRGDISKSRWFTRGWTLQELIAPPELRFYSKSWVLLGSKSQNGSFLEHLSKITGVDEDALSGSSELEYFSVATRMKWASHRRTTRVEDIAYCLMGIFNVNMPLLYGEGAKAFIRLQEEILRGNDDQSIFAWKCPETDPTSNQPSGLLAKSPQWFQDSEYFRPLPVNANESISVPSSMTNAGLYVQVSLQPIEKSALDSVNGQRNQPEQSDGLVAAILHCSPYTREEQDETIYKAALALQHLGGDRYARVQCDRILDLDSSKLDSTFYKPSYKYIYVKQNPVKGIPDISVDDRELWTNKKRKGKMKRKR